MIIIVKIAGGIGNQLFQYAYAKSLQYRFKSDLMVNIDSFENYSYSSVFELNKFISPIKIAGSDMTREQTGTYFLNEGIANSLLEIHNIPANCNILVISGYWQNEKYLDHKVVHDIYRAMQDKYHKSYIENISEIAHEGSVAVHIRRRDYQHMGLCTEEYYIACMRCLLEKDINLRIHLFSDEPNYSFFFMNKAFPGRVNHSSSKDDLLDLYMMSRFEKIIISNSSYSWWAAFFNEENKNIIINPSPWLYIENYVNPCPDRWISVENSVEEYSIDNAKISVYKNILEFKILQRQL